MSTYIYETSHLGKGNMIAKIENGKIYNTTGFLPMYLADSVGDKVYEVTNLGREPFFLTTKDNVVYYNYTFSVEPLYIASKGVIYEYSNYSKGNAVAQYTGDSTKAVQAYAAFVYFSKTTQEKSQSQNNTSNTHTTNSTNNNGSSNSAAGAGCGAGCGVFGLFGISAFIGFCQLYTEYLSLFFYICIPLLFLIIAIIVHIHNEIEGFSIVSFLLGAFTMAVFTFFINGFMHKYNDIQRVNVDFAMISGFIISGIALGLLTGNKND